MAGGVVDRDQGYADLLKEMLELSRGPHILVGIREAAGAVRGEGEGATVAEYATYNEFGTKNTPERSFLRSTVNERRDKYAGLLARAAGVAVDGGAFLQELEKIGAIASSDVQNKIRDLSTPPNVPSTIQRKGSSNPLIDTGRMRQSIDWEVRAEGAGSLSPGVGRGEAS
jgi:hypothetical protein